MENESSKRRVRIQSAGGWNERFIIHVEYFPRSGLKSKKIKSNHPGYGKSWATRAEITKADEDEFLAWINNGLSTGGGSVRRPSPCLTSEGPRFATRSSSRIDVAPCKEVRIGDAHMGNVQEAVLRCVNYLVDSVIRYNRHGKEVGSIDKVRYVKGKHRHKDKTVAQLRFSSRPSFITGRSRATKLTQRRCRGFAYRREVLQRNKATKAEADLQWLLEQEQRLATIVSRQNLYALLPDGMPAQTAIRFSSCRAHIALPSWHAGDYSDWQLQRVNRQAMVLHRFYELLADAITSNQESGFLYMVTSLAGAAGKVLGEDSVVASTVRLWHADYVAGDGVLRPDERGHYTRELLIMEEDVKNKFVKWSLKAAKNSDLNVATARDFLNDDLLLRLEVGHICDVVCVFTHTLLLRPCF